MYEDEILEERPISDLPDVTVDQVIERIVAGDSAWSTPEGPMKFGSMSWTPHLVHREKGALLHIHLSNQIRPFLIRRLEAARALEHRIHVVIDLASLYDEDTLTTLGSLDAEVHLLSSSQLHNGRYLLALLADESVPVASDVRTALGKTAWEMRQQGSAYEKGRRFEGLLAFLLAQIDDFKILERNYRGDTDEIDIVVQLDKISNRCWYSSGVPFLLVEAKNWQTAVPQKELSAFIFKISTKRGRCKIGIFVGASGFTSDAELQEVKLATTDLTVALIGPSQIEEWISHGDPDEFLESLISNAMLR